MRKVNVAVKSMDSLSVLWRPRCDRAGLPLKSGPVRMARKIFICNLNILSLRIFNESKASSG
jgi:hypothetical protein